MDRRIYDISQSAGGYAEFERLVKQGRKLHDQAVFDLFTRLTARVVRCAKGIRRVTTKKQASKACQQEMCQSVF
jgi:hypothetical protein